MSSITTSGLKRFTLACVLAIATTVSFSAVADAASWGTSTVAGDFSAAFSPNVFIFFVDDCTVEVGVVFDWTPYPNYAHVGGVRVNCFSTHRVIDATVALYHDNGSNGSRWVQYRNSNYGARYNSTGSGSAILYTPRYCVDAYRAYQWMVGVTVRTERAGLTGYSYNAKDPRGGC